MDKIEVLIVLDVSELKDKEKFERYVKREGFKIVEGEEYVYAGESTTSAFSTMAYILDVFKTGLQKVEFLDANLTFLLNETPFPTYYYDKDTKCFEEVK